MTLASLIAENCNTFNGITQGIIGTVDVADQSFHVTYTDNGTKKTIAITGQGQMPGTDEAFQSMISRMEKVNAKFTPATR